ncbi:haloacid dehalogenase type II [Actinomadura sp. DC4]|uniref:haloacid dehalogenase type II n=1 Tax=Actinomadura sp. DC4 TaxID=3055069 RepID=UPI0025B12A55|nr:haloacid dehalogenase type II [Actinomadura sp. DC4]MDN3355281.1 haloacid dehalogenase type II [Actinomadura sp. DC4]
MFDVNETLLDLGALDGLFEELFGAAVARREWFALAVHTALVTTATRRYESFAVIAGACLEPLAGRPVSPAERERLVRAMAELPPHPDVAGALTALRERGLRLAALSNNPLDLVRAQFRNAGLTPLVDEVLSAEEVRRLKPAPEPYRHAAERLGVGIGELMLVAAHGWDCAGARSAGARAALVRRGGAAPLPVGPRPDLVVPDLAGLVRELD